MRIRFKGTESGVVKKARYYSELFLHVNDNYSPVAPSLRLCVNRSQDKCLKCLGHEHESEILLDGNAKRCIMRCHFTGLSLGCRILLLHPYSQGAKPTSTSPNPSGIKWTWQHPTTRSLKELPDPRLRLIRAHRIPASGYVPTVLDYIGLFQCPQHT